MSGAPRPPPIDQEARQRIAADVDATLFVEAGAGTGKTTALVSRIVALVRTGRLTMEDLVAITFTEAAATELRSRVRGQLEAAAAALRHAVQLRRRDQLEAAAAVLIDAALADLISQSDDQLLAAAELCAGAARETDLAAIQTIHAFARTLLRTFPLEAGLPPDFVVWDDFPARLAFEERFRRWAFEEIAEDGPANLNVRAAVRRALIFGVTFEDLHDLAWQLEDLAGNGGLGGRADLPSALAWARRCALALADVSTLLPYCHNPSDAMAKQLYALEPLGPRLARLTTERQAQAALAALPSIKVNVGAQRNWGTQGGENVLAGIRDRLATVKEDLEGTLAQFGEITLVELLEYLGDFARAGREERRRAGAVTFHDLLVRGRDLLRDRPDVRARAQRRFRYLFVDEFQDTDPLQAEIVWLLAGDPAAVVGDDWTKIPLVPGKLFVVGDPKQAIYRFRRADIGLYLRLVSSVPAALRVHLVQNFRSDRVVLDWVNHHFSAAMQADPGIQADYVRLVASHDAGNQPNAAGVYPLGGPMLERADAVRQQSADDLARLIHAAVGRWTVRDQGGRRPARYADVCVLLPRRTGQHLLEAAFEAAGVPYRVESGSLVLDTPEVRDLLNCLWAIDDPSDQVALVAALRSPAYGCSDVDLLDWVESGRPLDYLEWNANQNQSSPRETSPVAGALGSLLAFHQARADRSAAATIEAFIHERMLAVGAFGQPRPREATRRLRYVVAQARSLADAGQQSLRAVVDWLEDRRQHEVRDVESPTPDADEDAVRILTMHGAKGLEFPIVALANLGSRSDNRPRALLVDEETGSLVVGLGRLAMGQYERAKEREGRHAEAELQRLLYVAATRARDHLILCLHHKGKGAPPTEPDVMTLAGQLYRSLQDYGGTGPNPLAPFPPREGGTNVAVSSPFPGREGGEGVRSGSPESDWLAAREAQIAAQSADRIIFVTDLAQRAGGLLTGADVARPVVESAGAPGAATDPDEPNPPNEARAIGRAVHQALAMLAAGDPRPIVAVVEETVGQLAPEGRAAAVAQLVAAIWSQPAVRGAIESGRVWAEVPVGAVVGASGKEWVVEGRIDLLFEATDGTLGILDFKSEPTGGEPRGTRDAIYRRQLAAYALAVQRATGRTVRLAQLVYASGTPAVVSYPDVPALLAEAQALVAALDPA
jgi:ATP-dependent helicase/nuclease subunit A